MKTNNTETMNHVYDLCDKALLAQLTSERFARKAEEARRMGDHARATKLSILAAKAEEEMNAFDSRAYRIESAYNRARAELALK